MTARAVFPAILGLACAAAAAPALAQSPDIARQQSELSQRRLDWERRDIPQGLAASRGFAPAPYTARDSGVDRAALLLRNVTFTFTNGIGFFVRNLAVTLEPKPPGDLVDFDRVGGFVIRIHRGEIVLRPAQLSALFNRHVLKDKPRSLSRMRVGTSYGRMRASADLRLRGGFPGFELPAHFGGGIALTPDNKLSYDIDEIDLFGLPVAWLLKRLGITLPELIELERPGVSLQAFALRLDHRKIFPLPALRGHIARARLGPDGLRLTFADSGGVAFDPPENAGDSFIWVQSGDLKFFGVVAINARILLTPQDRSKRLRFNLYDYRRQLSAATGRLGEDGVMTITTPD
jgi:hypothetical protein